jgi:integrase
MKLSKVNGQFAKSVGFYRKTLLGPRLQKRWYLGHDEAEAIVMAAKLVKAWRENVESNDRVVAMQRRAGITLSDAQAAPIWPLDFKIEHADETPEQTLARLEREGKYLSTDDVVEEFPLAAALEWYYGEKERRLTLRNRSRIRQSSVTQTRCNLRACLAPFPQFRRLADFNTANLQAIHDYWMGTNHKDRPGGKKETVEERTAVNYLNSLKAFLRACAAKSEFEYDLPKELGAWRFNLKPKEVVTPTLAELATIYQHASDRMKCFMLLALNAGQLSNDIGRMTVDDVEDPKVLRKVRLKTAEKVAYKGTWELWPETAKALKENRAGTGELLFVNKEGRPLYEQRAKSRADAIGDEFHKLVHRLIKKGEKIREDVTFSTLRAFGASFIANQAGSEYFAKLYLCHSVATGAARHYIDVQYAPLQPLLKELRTHLKGMLAGKPKIPPQSANPSNPKQSDPVADPAPRS